MKIFNLPRGNGKTIRLLYASEFSNAHNVVLYCDPPYENTTKYSTNKFDYDKFWNWCKVMSKNNYVYISSYEAPNDFKCIWHKDTLANFASKRKSADQQNKRIEKLFIYKHGLLGEKYKCETI